MARRGIAKMGLEEDILVVDNGSSDNTKRVALEHGARVISEPHRGYGSALRAGFNHARYDIIVMADADLTYDLENLDVLAKPLVDGVADFVMGNRMRNIESGAMPALHRYVGNPLLSFMLRLMFHTNAVHDSHCGMRAITRDAFRRLRCVTTGMEFASEMVVRALRCGLRIEERDISYHRRVGTSKLHSFRDGWRHLRFMILHSPTLMLLMPGAALWLLGLAISIPLGFSPIMIDGRAIDIHCMIVGGVLNIVGIQIITIGLLAKAYGHLSGLHEDPVVAWFYRWFTFEKVFLLSLVIVLSGLFIAMRVIAEWVTSGFGPLDQQRQLLLALLCVVNGVQIGSSSFLFGIMALPRHIEQLPPHVEQTGVVNT